MDGATTGRSPARRRSAAGLVGIYSREKSAASTSAAKPSRSDDVG